MLDDLAEEALEAGIDAVTGGDGLGTRVLKIGGVIVGVLGLGAAIYGSVQDSTLWTAAGVVGMILGAGAFAAGFFMGRH